MKAYNIRKQSWKAGKYYFGVVKLIDFKNITPSQKKTGFSHSIKILKSEFNNLVKCIEKYSIGNECLISWAYKSNEMNDTNTTVWVDVFSNYE